MEFHDQEWFPKILRDYVTDALQFVLSLGGVYRPIAQRLNDAVKASGAQRVVDLCSGGGGPWLWLYKLLGNQDGRYMEICLTDKYPNFPAFENAKHATDDRLTFFPGPVDAANLPAGLKGFRTMFTSFHHFSPGEAVAILQNAVDNRQGIGVFEAARRRPVTVLMTAFMPLGGLLAAVSLRPLKWSRLFWTYVIPVVPLVLYFDGVVSCLRSYSQKELLQLVAKVDSEDYAWQVGEETEGFAPVTYLLGYPRSRWMCRARQQLVPTGEEKLPKIHRIYTEDVHRGAMIRVIAKRFENFTLQPSTGYYRGKPEKSIVLEIAGASKSEIKWLAARIREINTQASVLVIGIDARVNKVTHRD